MPPSAPAIKRTSLPAGAEIALTTSFPGPVHLVDGNFVLASRAEQILVSHDAGVSWQVLCRLPIPMRGRLRSPLRLARRLCRDEVRHAARVGEFRFVFFAYRHIYCYDAQQSTFVNEPIPVCGSHPLSLCQVGESQLYYGEYRSNPERGPVRIMNSADGGETWTVARDISGVRHIHGVFADPFSDSLWMTTGDNDDESAVWISNDGFRTLDKVLSGNQQTRAVDLLFTEEHVYFGSDTPREQNALYRLPRGGQTPERLQDVPGSVFFGCQTQRGLYFSTACEPSSVNTQRSAQVWGTTDGVNWHNILTLAKDAWSMKYFQHGQIRFARGSESTADVWASPIATRHDGGCVKISGHAPLGN